MTSACRIRQIRAELVELRWNDGEFCVTADHAVLVKACGDSAWKAKQARNVRPQEDQLLVVPAPLPATSASSDLRWAMVTECNVYPDRSLSSKAVGPILSEKLGALSPKP